MGSLAQRIASLGSGRKRFDFTRGVLPWGAQNTRASSGTRFNGAGVLVTETTDVARFTFDPVTLALQGVLVEPARTNLCYPSNPNSSWSNGATYAVANQATSPDGTVNASKYKAATAVNPQIYRSMGITSGQPYSWSAFMRRDLGQPLPLDCLFINQATGTVSAVRFNLANAGASTVTLGAPTSRGITLHAAGFYYCYASDLATGTGTGYHQLNLCDPGSNVIAAPDANSGIFVYGAQLEQGALPSSLIPTVGGAVTRATDVLTLAAPNGAYAVDIERLSGVTRLTGQAVIGGAYTVPTDTSPLRSVLLRRM